MFLWHPRRAVAIEWKVRPSLRAEVLLGPRISLAGLERSSQLSVVLHHLSTSLSLWNHCVGLQRIDESHVRVALLLFRVG